MGASVTSGSMTEKEHWKSTPDEHDYPAAHDYLSLVMPRRPRHGW